jgi:AraC family transcriptional regulator of arabinose operon
MPFHEDRQIFASMFDPWSGPRTVRPGGTNDWLLIATVSGLGRVRYPGGRVDLPERSVLVTRPGTPHDYGPAPNHPWHLRWAHFHPRPHWLAWLAWPPASAGLMHLTISDRNLYDRIIDALAEAADHCHSPSRHQIGLAMCALERALILLDTANPRSRRARYDRRIVRAMDFMTDNLARKLTMTRIARAAGLSTSRLAHLFREQLGQTPGQFIEQQRMDQARQLLVLTTRPINEIARQLGFQSPFYFSRRFTRAVGISPREYRQTEPAGTDDL